MEDVVICGGVRTPIGSFMGALSGFKASELGTIVMKALLERTGIKPDQLDEVIMGQILGAGEGQHPARQAAIRAGIPPEVPALRIDKLCGSGLKAVHLATQAIKCGDARMILAGGQESMTRAPHILVGSRNGVKMGAWELQDSLLADGLFDTFKNYHMGVTAENVRRKYNITREEQDAFAAESQNRCEAAQKAGRFTDEIVPIEIPQRNKPPIVFSQDEFPRHGVTAAALGKIRPAFEKDGTVTAGNASGMNDGAAAVLVASASRAKELGLKPLARVVAYANAGLEPEIMGMGPVPSTRKCLEKAGWKLSDLDLIEANEAFAAQACACRNELGLDMSKVNVNGGAIALGHPVGASGARILVTLLYEMQRRKANRGLATLCIGGGMGVALAVERI
ncbi:MAG: acetyl-CoA C-acetyltransferase [Magnetococcales bacterium]|nr:acetyl-CoA C-acetyltransferase [Magnetococcales bacterium]MBF0156794.1 acetyl-CoA C-acetyltransferase [Magnetococcales bacterium]